MIRADLGDQLEAFVMQLVESGRYTSGSAVLQDGVRLIRDLEEHRATLDRSIAAGHAQADAGQTKPAEQVFDRRERKYRALSGGVD